MLAKLWMRRACHAVTPGDRRCRGTTDRLRDFAFERHPVPMVRVSGYRLSTARPLGEGAGSVSASIGTLPEGRSILGLLRSCVGCFAANTRDGVCRSLSLSAAARLVLLGVVERGQETRAWSALDSPG